MNRRLRRPAVHLQHATRAPMLQLLADRFICDRGRWFDLATARPVTIRVDRAGGRGHQFEWSDRCAALSRLRHPLLNPLLDYGYAGPHATFEAYAVTPPLRAGPVAASQAATHAVRFLRAHAIPLSRAVADVLVRPLRPGGRSRRPLGVVLQHRKILDTLAEVLDGGGTGLVSISVAGPPRSGVTTVRDVFARVARLAGYLPVGVDAARRWPELQRVTSGRHICVMSDDEGRLEPETRACWLTRLGLESTRRHLHLTFLRRTEAAPGALGLDALGVAAMTSMIYVDPDLGPSAKELVAAARLADGWPGRFLAALRAEPFDGFDHTSASTVHESSAPYIATRTTEPAVDRTPGDRANGRRRLASALARAERRAAALAAAGRHGAAIRLLERAIRVLHVRGERAEAGTCALRLGWIARSRGDAETALAQIERARGMTPDGALHVAASVLAGALWTDAGRHVEAEAALRGAVAAASTLRREDLAARASLALARVLLWQERRSEALAALEGLSGLNCPALSAEALAVSARIHATGGDMAAALRAGNQAVQQSSSVRDARLQAAAHRAMALALSAAGDSAGAAAHVLAGLRAAAIAHLPLAALRLRALWLATPRGSGVEEDGTRRRLYDSLRKAVGHRGLPHTVRVQIDAAFKTHEQGPHARCRTARLREGRDGREVVAELVDAGQRAPDDRAALERVLDVISSRTQASSIVIVAGADASRVLSAAGRPWRERPTCARRALDTGMAVAIDPATQPPEAAEPVKYAGNTVAAIACRWPAGCGVDTALTSQYLAAGALALSTHVQTLLEVRDPPPPGAWGDLLGQSPAASHLREAVQRAARAPFPVLIEGESGSGKELVARAIHRLSARRDRRFCAINCAAITDELVEAELFGHARGAFTGAAGERPGLFEEADGGSLFLDEVGELSARAQAKLLRVVQDGEVRRVGENFPRRVDVRLIAATNRRLEQEVAASRFRADLRFRLDVVRISVPALRERVADIPVLAEHFWQDASSRVGSRATLGPETLAALARYDWPGNVRELQNAIAWIAVHAPRRGKIGASLLPSQLAAAAPASARSFEAAREDFERRFVRAALAQTGGHRARTAELLGVSRQGLAKMLRRLRIE